MKRGDKKNQITGINKLLSNLRELILSARQSVVHTVNTLQVITNFEIGHRIVEYEQQGENRAQYGKQLLTNLSMNLTVEFGAGFSERNLRNMRKFYLVYQDRSPQIWQMPSAKLIGEQKSQAMSAKSKNVQVSKISQTPSAQLHRC